MCTLTGHKAGTLKLLKTVKYRNSPQLWTHEHLRILFYFPVLASYFRRLAKVIKLQRVNVQNVYWM
jgi:hypothetical protein